MMLSAPPVLLHASTVGRSAAARYPYSLKHAPTKTPVCERRSELAGIPACSNASHATSSRSRCCGSILAASRREISKNSASNASMSSRKEPHRVVRASAAPTSGEPSSKGCQRSGGTSPIEQLPSQRNFQSSSGPEIRPGKRQPRPTTAIGSSSEPRPAEAAAESADVSESGAVRNPTRALIVGFCQKSTGETDRPSSSANSPDSSRASREPTPTSFNDASRSISSASHPSLVQRLATSQSRSSTASVVFSVMKWCPYARIHFFGTAQHMTTGGPSRWW